MAAGIPCQGHKSDLICPVNADSYRIISSQTQFPNPEMFIDTQNILMYRIPYAYDPFWIKKHKRL